ncbi:thioredoxin-like protein HCF164, chloroplastic isoform X1 [Triticum urartu]|uniref:Thioredoxin-like protein HCF164, chloroplastic n=1 Tax=Triticum urartu TaxID=4572 RepID=A0A8R7RE92_TRIUA|nr:thioredoxin-like protein HCF164, chloroplastic isoform X1 [Triticum urartu]
MASVTSRCSGLLLPDLRPGLAGLRSRSPPLSSPCVHLRGGRRRPRTLSCVAPPDSAEPKTDEQNVKAELGEEKPQPSSSSSSSTPQEAAAEPPVPDRGLNRRIAVLTTLAAVGLFGSQRLQLGGFSLKDLAANAVPYEEALSNGKPTVVEFYADWCEVCRELAPDIYKIEQQYKDRINFVMLNVDNTKWEQELDEFGVEGIPHFAFLDKEGNEEGNVVGKLPRQYFLDNVVALSSGDPTIPHARAVGQYSSAEFRKVHQVADPRSHG